MLDTEVKLRKPRTTHRGGWWVNDAELIEIIGVPEKIARQAIAILDRDIRSGFPQKQELWGNRRYRPAVEAYFQHHYGYRLSVHR